MAAHLYNLVRMTTPTTGAGTITLGAALPSFLSFQQAGAQDGVVGYAIDDGNNREIGRGQYNAAAQTLTRGVLRSTNNNNPIVLTGNAQVSSAASAEDFGGGVTISDVAPANPSEGDLWWDAVDGQLYIWHVNPDGISSQWVVTNSMRGPPGEQGPQGQTGAKGDPGPMGPSGIPRRYIAGLQLAIVDANTFTVGDGIAAAHGSDEGVILPSSITKTTAAWAAGSSNGALDTGTIAQGWFHVFLIKRPDTQAVDVLISLSPTAPTLPVNYTLFRRIGSIAYVGGVFLPFTQFGDEFIWVEPVTNLDNQIMADSVAIRVPLSVPPGFPMLARVRILWVTGTTGAGVVINSFYEAQKNVNFPWGNTSAIVMGATSYTSFGDLLIRTDVNSGIRALAQAGNGQLGLCTVGWFDNRGKDFD